MIEYNTSGRDIVIGRSYLSDEAARLCARHGVKLALASDAHAPRHAGRHFREAVEALRAIGFREVLAVRDRERIRVPL